MLDPQVPAHVMRLRRSAAQRAGLRLFLVAASDEPPSSTPRARETAQAAVTRPADRPALVQGRGHLPGQRQGVLRLQRRRRRRLQGPDVQARLHPRPRRQHDLADAVLSVAAARRRLRHCRLSQHPPAVRHAQRLPRDAARSAPARAEGDHRAGHQPHLRRASVVPGRAPRAARLDQARLLRVERQRREVQGHAHHLPRHREVELDLGPGGQGLLLAPLLQPPARPQLRQPARAAGGLPHDALLARHGRRRLSARCDPVPDRARGHEQREPARDARGDQEAARGDRRALPEPLPARRGQPVARRRERVFRQRRRVPDGVSLPADAAHLHGHCAGRPPPGGRNHAADAGAARQLPVGDLPAQP